MNQVFPILVSALLLLPAGAVTHGVPSPHGDVADNASNFSGEGKAGAPEKIRVMGEWGFEGENTSAGQFTAVLKKTRRFVVFRGVISTSDGKVRAKMAGIIKRCYMNGVVIAGGKKIPFTGLVRVNIKERTFTAKWITPKHSGWMRGTPSVWNA